MERWLVVYDTPSDKRRRRVAQILDAYGERVQFSVFEVFAEGAHWERMVSRLGRVVDEEEDRLRLYPACDRCARAVVSLAGRGQEPWQRRDKVLIV